MKKIKLKKFKLSKKFKKKMILFSTKIFLMNLPEQFICKKLTSCKNL